MWLNTQILQQKGWGVERSYISHGGVRMGVETFGYPIGDCL
jgi:hypothetical protein